MLHEISVSEVILKPMDAFDKGWMALTAGNEERGYNSMTVSWGHLGTVWSRPTAICYVRPQRYTKQFMDREEIFTLSWFGDEQRKALGILGSKSGRDCDKIAEACLTPVFSDNTAYFEEAKLVFICRKLYQAPLLKECFHDKSVIEETYAAEDFHDLYVGEIIKVLKAD